MKPLSRAFRKRKLHPLTWRRRWRIILLDLLGREDSPERVAAAIALGIGIGFSPFLGLHAVSALALAWIFRLNKIDALLGQLIGQPWTYGPIFYAGYSLGRKLLRLENETSPSFQLNRLLESDISWVVHPVQSLRAVFGVRALTPGVLSFLVGTTILSILIGLASYTVTLEVLRVYHRRHPRVAQRAARRRAQKTKG